MEPFYQRLISVLFAACLASETCAQDRQAEDRQAGQTAPKAETAVPADKPSLTGKERLGKKWMDEQRIDNCNVPIDKRGSRPRPGNCLHSPSG